MLLLCVLLGGCVDAATSDDRADAGDAGAGALGPDSKSGQGGRSLGDADALDDAGADGSGRGAAAADPDAASAVTYHGSIRRILEAHCLPCHADGALASPSLGSWPQVQAVAALVADSVARGSMPPWQPDPDCRAIANPRALSEEEVAAVARWFELGAPEGDPADYDADADLGSPLPDLGPPDITVGSGVDYALPQGSSESTVCFPLDVDLSQGLRVRATEVRPEVSAMVHHAVVWSIDASLAVPTAANGWACGYNGKMVGGWLPGNVPVSYPQGVATELGAAERLILELHYHSAALPPGEMLTDQTEVNIWTLPREQAATHVLAFVSVTVPELFVPAGDPEVTFADAMAFDEGVTVVGMVPHMHYLGTRIDAQIVRAAGGEECLVSIPAWDFELQQMYFLPDDAFVLLEPGDSVRVTCTYDNSPANQPVIDGAQVTPKDVLDGWSSRDEMCQTTLLMRVPL